MGADRGSDQRLVKRRASEAPALGRLRLIGTAPRDGTIILAWLAGHRWPTAILWRNHELDVANELGERGYWAFADDVLTDMIGEAEDPMCWMPLPPSPVSDAGRGLKRNATCPENQILALAKRVEAGSGDDEALSMEVWQIFKRASTHILVSTDAVEALRQRLMPGSNIHSGSDDGGRTWLAWLGATSNPQVEYDGRAATEPRARLAALLRAYSIAGPAHQAGPGREV
ncbi:hypothetical protein LMIY3S_03675 [Labrys miyagiensis]